MTDHEKELKELEQEISDLHIAHHKELKGLEQNMVNFYESVIEKFDHDIGCHLGSVESYMKELSHPDYYEGNQELALKKMRKYSLLADSFQKAKQIVIDKGDEHFHITGDIITIKHFIYKPLEVKKEE